jgi:hypothetical protein
LPKPSPRSAVSAEIRPADIAARAAKAVKQIRELRQERDEASAVAQQAQVREALTRSELSLALLETLKARDAARAVARRAAPALYAARSRQPHNLSTRAGRLRRAAWLRAGDEGEARLLIDAGLWRTDDAAAATAYARRKADPAAQPDSLFDQAWYLSRHPECAGYGRTPLTHYLLHGAQKGFAPHPVFDLGWYGRQAAGSPDVNALSPLAHYLLRGAARGISPQPLFDIAHYLVQEPQLAPGEDPLGHYLRQGWRDGLSPHPLFDPQWYVGHAGGPVEGPPLTHYVTEGWRRRLSPHPLFDARWYLERNADLGDQDALAHFVTSGGAEGRDPSPWFDVARYRAARGAGLAADANPLVDYLQGGAWAVAEATPGLPTAAYLAATPEVTAQGLTPLEHWARRGGVL